MLGWGSFPWTTAASGDIISNAISAANLITPNNLLVKSNKDIAVNDVKLEAPKSKKKKVVKLLNFRSLSCSRRLSHQFWILLSMFSRFSFLFKKHKFFITFGKIDNYTTEVSVCHSSLCGLALAISVLWYSKASRYAVFGSRKKPCSSKPHFVRFIPMY